MYNAASDHALRHGLNLLRSIAINQQIRCMGGTRGARGHGWFKKYRAGLGGRHLQGRHDNRDRQKLASINDEVFALNRSFVDDSTASTNNHTTAYIDLQIDGNDNDTNRQRIVIELASAALPNTCGNFAALCRDGSSSHGYELTKVFKIVKDTGLCLGDNTPNNNGEGGRCHPDFASERHNPYSFNHESTALSHSQKGMVTMLSSGLDKNDSRFMITMADAPQLDGKYVAFGRVKEGLEWLENTAFNTFTKRGMPITKIEVVSSGLL